jgi:hypothetical protein
MSDDWFASTLASMVPPTSSNNVKATSKNEKQPIKQTLTEHRIQRQIFLQVKNETPYKWNLTIHAMFEGEKRVQKPIQVSKEIYPGEILDEYWLTLYMNNLVFIQSLEAFCILNKNDSSESKVYIQEQNPSKRTYFQLSDSDNCCVVIKMDSKPDLPHQWLVFPTITHSFDKRLSQSEE